MSQFENYSDLLGAPSISPAAARAAEADGSTVDLVGYSGATVFIVTGVVTDGNTTFELEESDNDADWDAVGAADVVGTQPVINDAGQSNAVFSYGYIGQKRYIRATTSYAGGGTGAIYGAFIVKGVPRHAPTQ